jgi:uncharacterized protein (DUF1684 family)
MAGRFRGFPVGAALTLLLSGAFPAVAEGPSSVPSDPQPQNSAPAGPGFAPDFLERLLRHRDNLDFRFRDRILSPLSEPDRQSFQGLDYFDPAPELALTAIFERAGDRSVFAMPTYDRRTLRYSHYGTFTTALGEQRVQLKAFRREEEDGRRDLLLVPFRDATNGSETYAGGRYIELSLPVPDAPVLDFNRAMNPLCAYDPSYACPIPPPENRVAMPIRAGEKQYPGEPRSLPSRS